MKLKRACRLAGKRVGDLRQVTAIKLWVTSKLKGGCPIGRCARLGFLAVGHPSIEGEGVDEA